LDHRFFAWIRRFPFATVLSLGHLNTRLAGADSQKSMMIYSALPITIL
jgi:hypothetical protein